MSPYDLTQLAWIGLGSNLGDRDATLDAALSGLASLSLCAPLCSPRYLSPPWGVTDQPSFINQVVGIAPRPPLEASELLESLLRLEASLGRIRGRRWGPRTLDLDLLAWGARVVQTERLTLPHPRLCERRFVLEPWAQLAPELTLPGFDRPLVALLEGCADLGELTQRKKRQLEG